MNWRIITAVVLLSSAPSVAQACTNPAGEAGDQVYNTTHNVMQYCNGTNWVAMGSHAADGDGLGDHAATQALDMGGFRIENLAPPTADNHAVTRAYVTSAIAAIPAPTTPNLSAVLATGNAAGNRKITGLATPTVGTDAAHKTYVDGKFGALTNGKWCRGSGTQVICDQDAPAGNGSCSGTSYNGGCWYLGWRNESCVSTCIGRGGYVNRSSEFNTDAKCNALLDALGVPASSLTSYNSNSYGCIYAGDRRRYYSSYDPNTSNASFRIACSCAK